MSGQSVDNGKKNNTGLYIPLALGIFLAFLPVLLFGGWYLRRTLKNELLKFETGLSWITVSRLLETEAERFDEAVNDGSREELDLRALSSETLFPAHRLGFTNALLFGIRESEVHSLRSQDDELIRYIYYDQNHELTELDTESGNAVRIEEGSDYYSYASMALSEKVPDRSLMAVGYQWNDESYYASFLPVMTNKPVRFGEHLLSDGSEGSCILICGQLNFSITEKMINFHVVRSTLIIYIALMIVVLFICSAVSWALGGPRKLHRSIRVIRRDNSLPFENVRTFRSSAFSPEIKELMENFQLMFLSIQEYQESISSIRKLYEPLLPAALLELFGREDIREIRPGDTVLVTGEAVELHLEGDTKNPGTKAGRNHYLAKLLDILQDAGMIVTELDTEHILALKCALENEPADFVKKDLVPRLYEADRKGSGVGEIRADVSEGEFQLFVTGIPEHMAIHMEKVSLDTESLPQAEV